MRRLLICTLCLLVSQLVAMTQIKPEDNAVVMMAAADSLAKQMKYAEARRIYEQILPLADDTTRQIVREKIPWMHYYEGRLHALQMNFFSSIECSKKALAGFHEQGNTAGEMGSHYLIGFAYELMDLTSEAMEAYGKAAILATTIGDDTELMSILSTQHKLSTQSGETEYSAEILSKIDSLANRSEDVITRIVYYNYMGDEASRQSKYDLAEQWYRRDEACLGQLNDDSREGHLSLYLLKMTNLFMKAQKWDEALLYARRYKDQYLKTRDESEVNYPLLYWNIVNIYRVKGDSIRCFESLDSVRLLIDKAKEPRIPYFYFTLASQCYNSFKNYEQSLVSAKKADEILATKYDEYDADRVRALKQVITCEMEAEHFDEAERLAHDYVKRVERTFGEYQIEQLDALKVLAKAKFCAGHHAEACKDYAKAIEKLKMQLSYRLPYSSLAEREAYWQNVYQNLLQNMTGIAFETGALQTDFTATCYDGLVLTKAFLLESERSAFDLIKSKGTAEDLRDFTKISAMQAKIRVWEKKGSAFADSITDMAARSRLLETQLARRCSSFGDVTAFMNVGYQEIKDKLHDDEVLIDFTDYITEGQRKGYAAYLIDNQQEYPLLIPLFPEGRIDSMRIVRPDMYYEPPYADTICHLLWEPLAGHVKEGSTIYYVPSQKLFQLAIESLPADGESLLGDHYRFIRLSCARELARLAPVLRMEEKKHEANAVLYGGLQYDLSLNEMAMEASKYDIPSLLIVRGSISRGDSLFRELPETKKEIEGIEALLKARNLTVISYLGKYGTEESFLNLSGRPPHILHLATHGFYYKPDEALEVDYLKGYKDAMNLSGLIMSGGNAAWSGKEQPKGVLGGILTAANIARLDLEGVQMAVLSACQTGQGEATHEGLYGLQRAFKKAGVKTLVMSLWNVSDVATRQFMVRFYERLVDNGWDKRKAFDDARSYIRDKYPEPYYWAGFVMLD